MTAELEGEHPHTRVVRSLMEAFARQDRAAIEDLLAPECVWRVPGDNGLAGTYEGRDAVLGLFRTLKRLLSAPAEFEVIAIATSIDRVMTYQYGVVVVAGQRVRLKECLVYRISQGHVVEVDEFQADQAAFDGLFTREVVAAVQTA
jgi:ketosteroid isomerase-like protein